MILAYLRIEKKVSEPIGKSQLMDIMWCDPNLNISGRGVRGPSNDLAVGKGELLTYCSNNHQETIIRSHECVKDGALYQPFDGKHLYTVFSHSMYKQILTQ
jgi:hypothetical protein